MTPKQKAIELYGKMYMIDDPMGNYPMCCGTAKLCALIAVDEILNNDNNFFNTHSQNDYWLQVKQEIEKI